MRATPTKSTGMKEIYEGTSYVTPGAYPGEVHEVRSGQWKAFKSDEMETKWLFIWKILEGDFGGLMVASKPITPKLYFGAGERKNSNLYNWSEVLFGKGNVNMADEGGGHDAIEYHGARALIIVKDVDSRGGDNTFSRVEDLLALQGHTPSPAQPTPPPMPPPAPTPPPGEHGALAQEEAAPKDPAKGFALGTASDETWVLADYRVAIMATLKALASEDMNQGDILAASSHVEGKHGAVESVEQFARIAHASETYNNLLKLLAKAETQPGLL